MSEILKSTIKTSRPISWINTAYPFTATYLFINQSIDAYLLLGSFYFLFAYNLLMYGVNDVFDYESDKNNPRKDSVEGAILEKSIHKKILSIILIVNIPLLVWFSYLSTAASFLALMFVVFMAIAYSAPPLRFKEIPLLDSITSSTHFVGPMVVALVYLGAFSQAGVIVLAFFLWGMASHAFGAIQDIIPDRKGKISSIATFFGAKNTLYISFFAYLFSSLILMFYSKTTLAVGLSGLLYCLNVASFIGVNDKTSAKTNTGWKRFIYLNWFAGFVITISLILAY